MPKTRQAETRRESVARRVGAVQWALLLRGVVIIGRRWTALSSKERARLAQLVRESRGNVKSLSKKQQVELRKLVRRLDLSGLGRELMPLVRGGRRAGRGSRRARR